jgi:tetratricopeptide (TPR) repeat protein
LPPSRRAVWTALISLAAVGIYANTLGHGFVFDDVALISQNAVVRNLDWKGILSYSGYRPLRTLTYALNYALGGEDPFGYHLFNVLLHALNAALVFRLFLLLGQTDWPARLGALFFAIHPAQTAAVAYVSGRKDLLAALFVLTGCCLYVKARSQSKPYLLAASFLSFALGVLSKEVAIVFPAFLLWIDGFLLDRESTTRPPQPGLWEALGRAVVRSKLLYGLCALSALAAAYHAVFVVQASRMIGYWGGSWSSNFGTGFKLFAHYLKLAIFPHPLIADYIGKVFDISKGLLEPATVLSMLLLAAYVVTALWVHRHNSRLTFGMFWFLTGLAPVLQWVPFHELAADHFLYIPLIGVGWIAAVAVDRSRRRVEFAPLQWVAIGIIGLTFGVMTVRRNEDWKDELRLWETTYRTAPGSYRANSNLGSLYQGLGDTARAVEFTRRSVELDPKRALSWSNLGGLRRLQASQLREAGRLDDAQMVNAEAVACLERAVVLDPADPWAAANLGQAHREMGLIWELKGEAGKAFDSRNLAIRQFQRALRIGSDNPVYHLIWDEFGRVFMDGGYPDQAVDYLRRAVAAYPDNPGINNRIAVCYVKLKKYSEAIPYLEKVVRLAPNLETWGTLARSYEEIGDNRMSIQTYERALRQYPSSVETHYNLGVLYHRVGETELAVRYLETALRLAPSGPLAGNVKQMLLIIKGNVPR